MSYQQFRSMSEAGQASKKKGPSFLGRVFSLALTIVLALAIAWFLQTFIFQFYQVQQDSMDPTLQPGQYILVDKLTGNLLPYTRGDVVVIRTPEIVAAGGLNTPFVKRIVGLPGETVELKDGLVYIGGQTFSEPYVNSTSGTAPELNHPSKWVIPAGQVFVMGDHRDVSRDSRDFGPVAISSIIGRAYIRAWPNPVFFNPAPWDNQR